VRDGAEVSGLAREPEDPPEGAHLTVDGAGRRLLLLAVGHVAADGVGRDVDGALAGEVGPEMGDPRLGGELRAPPVDLVVLEVVRGQLVEREALLAGADEPPGPEAVGADLVDSLAELTLGHAPVRGPAALALLLASMAVRDPPVAAAGSPEDSPHASHALPPFGWCRTPTTVPGRGHARPTPG
jgi:hypothetical protein